MEAKEGNGGTWRKDGRKETGERLLRRERVKGRVGMLEKRETVERKGKVEARERWERCRGKDGRKGRKGWEERKRGGKELIRGKEGTWRKEGKRRGIEGKEGKAR